MMTMKNDGEGDDDDSACSDSRSNGSDADCCVGMYVHCCMLATPGPSER